MKRLFTNTDDTSVGIRVDEGYNIKEFINHKQIISFLTKRDSSRSKYQQYDEQIAEISYEYDHDFKYSKFQSRERSHSFNFAIPTMFPNWALKLDSSQRKNAIEEFSSRYYISNETLKTVKNSVSLIYSNFKDDRFINCITELALPIGFNSINTVSFLKFYAFYCKKLVL